MTHLATVSTDFSPHSAPTILQVIPALKSGGVEVETLEIATAILAAGGKAIIASAAGELSSDPRTEGVVLKVLPLNTKNPFKMFKNSKLLKKLIREEKVNIVHVRSRGPAWSAYKAAKEAHVPFLTTYHAAYRSGSVFKNFYNSIMAKGDRVIAISAFIEKHIKEKYASFSWFDSSRIRLIERGIDLAYFNPDAVPPKKAEQLRVAWGISPDTKVILLLGRISKPKGQEILIRALALMKRGDVVVLLVGSAQGHEGYRDSLLQLAASLDLEGRVKWIPPLSEIAPVYQLADLVACPSLTPEGFGRLMAEAQAMKKPIIAAHHGAAVDIVENGRTGWLVPPGDVGALAEALDAALELSQAEYDAMGSRGRARVTALFSKESMFSKTIAVYKELLDDPSARR